MTDLADRPRERLYSLDAARAIAALAVVFQHWEHFFSISAFSAAKEDSPLYWLFAPVYEKGARAVTFFFCLSGFIFYWLYASRIHDRKVGPATFAVLRLSRLYPLHVATLIICVVLQWPLIEMLGKPFIYPEHDVQHFALNFFLIQYWGFEDGYSFNGPSWSISVEVFLYIAFFLACRLLRPSIWQCLAFAAAGVLLARFSILAGAAVPFFLGGAACFLYRALRLRWSQAKNFALVAVTIILWIALPFISHPTLLSSVAQSLGGGRVAELVVALLGALGERQFELILFPLTVLSLSLSEIAWKRLPWSSLHELGNMSFGIYLLHFPLQLTFVLVALGLDLPRDTFTHTSTLGLFVLLLLIVAAFSYRFFERPAMSALRASWPRRDSTLGALATPTAES